MDDFCKEFEQEIQKHRLTAKDKKSRNRNRTLSDLEMISILILFHYGQFTNFKAFYIYYVSAHLKDYFPQLISYNRFVELMPRVAVPMMLFLKSKCLGKSSGISFIDSTYRFKLYLIINDKGEILSFYLTKVNIDDRNLKMIANMTKEILGKLFGDKGYISKLHSGYSIWSRNPTHHKTKKKYESTEPFANRENTT